MNAVILIITVLCYSAQSIFPKIYNESQPNKSSGSLYFFNICMTFSALIFFFIVSEGKLTLHIPTLLFGLGFGICYGTAFLFNLLAIRNGPMSLTVLIVSYSLIVPAIYGVLFLHEAVKLSILIGIVFLLLSLLLVNKKSDKVTVTKKWALYAFLAFLGNGGCSTVQKCHQVIYPGLYQSELMISALIPVAIFFCILFTLCCDKPNRNEAKKGLIFPLLTGVSNGAVNLLVMVLSTKMPAVLLFPIISGGGIVVTYFTARFLFKEHLSVIQKIGFALGTVSVIVMNL